MNKKTKQSIRDIGSELFAAQEAKEAKSLDIIEEVEIDETGLHQDDIELIMAQVECTRAKAVQALRASNSDIVEAIMRLSDN